MKEYPKAIKKTAIVVHVLFFFTVIFLFCWPLTTKYLQYFCGYFNCRFMLNRVIDLPLFITFVSIVFIIVVLIRFIVVLYEKRTFKNLFFFYSLFFLLILHIAGFVFADHYATKYGSSFFIKGFKNRVKEMDLTPVYSLIEKYSDESFVPTDASWHILNLYEARRNERSLKRPEGTLRTRFFPYIIPSYQLPLPSISEEYVDLSSEIYRVDPNQLPRSVLPGNEPRSIFLYKDADYIIFIIEWRSFRGYGYYICVPNTDKLPFEDYHKGSEVKPGVYVWGNFNSYS